MLSAGDKDCCTREIKQGVENFAVVRKLYLIIMVLFYF